VNPDKVASLAIETRRKKNVYDEYKGFELKSQDGPKRVMYLPIEKQNMLGYTYFAEYINPDQFKNALFRDPAKVRRDSTQNGVQFTDDRSVMNVDYSTNMIDYINPGQETITQTNNNNRDLLKRSIDFVNEHEGWTDSYRYFDMGIFERKVVFRLFSNNYPVFNEQGMTEISQYWGSEEILKYKRPYFLKHPFGVSTNTTLPSGEYVFNTLLEDPGFKQDMLESILVGYRLFKTSSNTETEVLTLEPSWYYLYAGSWIRFERGDMSGLE